MADAADQDPVEEISTPGAEAEELAEDGDEPVADVAGIAAHLPPGMAEMLKANPAMLTALAAMQGLEGRSSGFLESLPAPVKRRVKALKKLQSEAIQLDVEYHKEVAALGAKYHALKAPLYEKRASMVSGSHEPTDEEAAWEYDEEEMVDDPDEEADDAGAGPAADGEAGEADVAGVPYFWLTVLQNCPPVASTIEDHDCDVLKTLTDVTLTQDEQHNTTFHFHFAENEWFEGGPTVLTKKYFVSADAEEGDLEYDGMSYEHAEGCTINWKAGKNVTVVEKKKKQRKRDGANAGKVRIKRKIEPVDSFFRFFEPPKKPTDDEFDQMPEELAEQVEEALEEDFALADMLKEYVIPNAVNWFTGDALDTYQDELGMDDEDDDEEGLAGMMGGGMGGEDDEDDPDWKPPANFDFSKAEQPADCKQQ